MTDYTYTTAGATQFWRCYEVTLDNGDGVVHRYGNRAKGASNLRVAFSVERRYAGPGPRSLTLTNLAPASRSAIRSLDPVSADAASVNEAIKTPGLGGTLITVKAGYAAEMSTMFIGSVTKIVTERAGADIHTHLELMDAESFTNACVFRASYAASPTLTGGVKLTTILHDIAETMQVTYRNATVRVVGGVALGIKEQTFPRGIVFNGTCGAALRTLLRPQGLVATVLNGTLNIVPKKGYDGQEVVLLRPETGLIKNPVARVDKGFRVVQFQTLLNARIQPNRLVAFVAPNQIIGSGGLLRDSESLTGYWKVVQTVHKGDTHGPDWTVSGEAMPYEGTLTAIPVAVGTDYTKAVS